MQTLTCDLAVMDQIVVLNLDISVWSGKARLEPADLGAAELPPEDLASLGSKKTCDPVALRAFNKYKTQAFTLLDKTGVRFLGGWAVPESKIKKIEDLLKNISDRFYQAKGEFMSNYDHIVNTWIARHPGWESIINRSIVSSAHVDSRLKFKWQFFKVTSPQSVTGEAEHLHKEVEELGNTLYLEIAKAARITWNKVFDGKDEVSHKALSPLKTLYDKLKGLSFIEPHVLPVADLIETAINSVPKDGYITGANLLMLQGLVSMLMQPAMIINHAGKILAGTDPADLITNLCSGPLPLADAEAEDIEPDAPDSDDQDGQDEPIDIITPENPAAANVESCGLW